jgi:hypothetical protein
MARLSVCVSGGYITADVRTSGPVLEEALQHEKAEAVVRCAVLMALSALAEGDRWPNAVLESMASFMSRMDNAVRTQVDDVVLHPVAGGGSAHRLAPDGGRAAVTLPASDRARPARRGPAVLQSRR